jgi:hypothetical protein
MKRIFAGSAVLAALAVTACGGDAEPKAPATADVATPAAAPSTVEASPGTTAVSAAVPAAPNAPDFAVLYPDATTVGPATIARGPTGPGGILTFTTEAEPDAVVTFYREQAEATGLTTIASMNQGGARAYSAGDGANGTGKLLSVVATPGEDGPTNVQLSWTAGR